MTKVNTLRSYITLISTMDVVLADILAINRLIKDSPLDTALQSNVILPGLPADLVHLHYTNTDHRLAVF